VLESGLKAGDQILLEGYPKRIGKLNLKLSMLGR
jgi:hypothetical protein